MTSGADASLPDVSVTAPPGLDAEAGEPAKPSPGLRAATVLFGWLNTSEPKFRSEFVFRALACKSCNYGHVSVTILFSR